MYKIQYLQWFTDLPNEAKIAYGALAATKKIVGK
jgi:hypothetical protein